MEIVLHIGQSKTGSSSIQSFLTLNREKLIEAGVLYPVPTIRGMKLDYGNHNPFADALMGKLRYPYLTAAQYLQLFFEQAEQTKTNKMILSAEHFFGGEPRIWNVQDEKLYFVDYTEKIQRLGALLAGHDLSVLIYLRPQVDWLASTISQNIRIERLIKADTLYSSDQQFFELIKPLLRYHKLLQIWEQNLPTKKVRAIMYDRSQLHQKNSIADFLMRVGLGSLDLPSYSRGLEANPSLSRVYVEVKKLINKEKRDTIQERVIITCLKRLSAQLPGFEPYAISEELALQVEELVDEENALLNQKYVDGAPLVARGRSTQDLSSVRTISQEEINAAFEKFHREYRKPSYRVLHLNIAAKILLRDRMPVVHSFLHQFKRLYLRLKNV